MSEPRQVPRRLRRWWRVEAHRYAGGESRPLAGYAGAMAAYGGFVLAIAGAARIAGRRLPDTVSTADLLLVTVATSKLARLLAKDPVTSPLRAPFTRYEGLSGPAELAEEVRGDGARKTVGELVTCPFCLGQWVATAFMGGLVLAPRATRQAAAVFTALFGADLLQYVYAKVEQSR